MKEAQFYKIFDEKKGIVQCDLCPHLCRIAPGKFGICRTRKNEEGKLFAAVYDSYTSVGLDPMEKKPLYHFYPGREILSMGTLGCNFHCKFCQNWEISQRGVGEVQTRQIKSEDAVLLAKKYDSLGICYTYNEPLINYEYLLETAKLAKENNLVNVLVTNGYINEEPLMQLLPSIDAANIDVKSIRNDFYKGNCNGSVSEVTRTVEIMFEHKKHIEITNLIIPSLNDSSRDIEDLCDWISSLSQDIPLHFSRYHPCYKMTIKATPFKTLEEARKIGIKRLNYVYLGNVWEESESNTYCPKCNELLVLRRGYKAEIVGCIGNTCKNCGETINLVV